MEEIDKYFLYYNQFPEWFRYNKNINIILDRGEVEKYSNDNNCKLGVVFENDFLSLIVDLVEDSEGKKYTYARILNKNKYDGVVVIPKLNGKIVLLKQYRHGTRNYEIELPRGFSEKSKTIKENAESEIYEELGVKAKNFKYLGNIISNSGLSGGLVHIFSCEIDDIKKLANNEGIEDILIVTFIEAEKMIKKNVIRDSFTINALYKYKILRGR
ncbi:NUDIX hydrolase [Clostridium perfringens]|nr:NUDIX hydrolase [Clostridium perfringens]